MSEAGGVIHSEISVRPPIVGQLDKGQESIRPLQRMIDSLRRISVKKLIAKDGANTEYVKSVNGATDVMRFEKSYKGGGKEEFAALSHLYAVDPLHVARPIRLNVEDGEVKGYTAEYIDGISLTRYLRSHSALPTAILGQIESALRSFHANGLAHGDVKPSNILLGVDGRVKFIDPVGYGDIQREDLDKYIAYDWESLATWAKNSSSVSKR